MKRLLCVCACLAILSAFPARAQTCECEEPAPKWPLSQWRFGFGYSGMAQIHEDTTIAYPAGFYAELSRKIDKDSLGSSFSLIASTTYHSKNEEGITQAFFGFLAGISGVFPIGATERVWDDGSMFYVAMQGGAERSLVSGRISVPGITSIVLDESATGAAFQVEGGFLFPVNRDALVKLSGTYRASWYDVQSEFQRADALIWSVGLVLKP